MSEIDLHQMINFFADAGMEVHVIDEHTPPPPPSLRQVIVRTPEEDWRLAWMVHDHENDPLVFLIQDPDDGFWTIWQVDEVIEYCTEWEVVS